MTICIPGSALQVSQLDNDTLSIIGADILLSQSDLPYQIPAQGPLPPSQTDVVVYGTHITIDGDLLNPGRSITLIARRITAVAGTFIDVSGADQPNQYDAPAEQTDRTIGAPGAPGKGGAPGSDGGAIRIAADELAVTPRGTSTGVCTPQRAAVLERSFRQTVAAALAGYSATAGLGSVAVAGFSGNPAQLPPLFGIEISGITVSGLQNVAGIAVQYSAATQQLEALITLGPATVTAGSVETTGLAQVSGTLEFTCAPTLQLTFTLGTDLSLSGGVCTLSSIGATFAGLYCDLGWALGDLGGMGIDGLNQTVMPQFTAWLLQQLTASLATATAALVTAVAGGYLSPQVGSGAALVLTACGGAGGRGEDGHAGMTGGPGAPGGQVDLPLGGPPPPAACGGPGQMGGAGGDAGPSGNGGDGGTVTVSLVELPGAGAGVVVLVGGGIGGAAATAGTPGDGGPGGAAGSYAIPSYSPVFPPPAPQMVPGQPGVQGPWGALAAELGAMGSAGNPGSATLNAIPLPASGPASGIASFTRRDLAPLLRLPQLGFARQAAEIAYLNAQSAADYTTVAQLYSWLAAVTAPFTAGGNNFPNITNSDAAARAAIHNSAIVELQRLAASLDYFGNPFNWVPVLTWNALSGRVSGLLALGQIIDTQLQTAIANQDQQIAAATAAATQLNNDIANLSRSIAALTTQVKQMDRQIDAFTAQIEAQQARVQADLTAAQAAYTKQTTGCGTAQVLTALGSIVSVAGSVASVVMNIRSGNAAGAANSTPGVISGAENLVAQLEPCDAKSFQGLADAWQALQTALNQYGSNAALIAANVENFDNLLQQYLAALPQTTTDRIEAEINDLVALIQQRNQIQVNYTAHYAQLLRLQSRLNRRQADLENIAALLAAAENPELPVYLAFLRGALNDISQEIIAELYAENQAVQYWSVESVPFSISGSDLASLSAAAASMQQAVQGYLDGSARPFAAFQNVTVTVDAAAAPSAFARLKQGKPLLIQLTPGNSGEAFVNAFSVTAEAIGVALPGITPPVGSEAQPTLLQVLITQNGPDTRISPDGTTLVFTHPPRAILYEYNFTTDSVTIDGTIGDTDQGFNGLSPFATWTLDFSSSVNSWLNLSQIDSVELTFAGTLLGPNSAQARWVAGRA